MAEDVKTFSITAPGFSGLNLSDSPVDMTPDFATQVNNCIIDKAGRVASRKGWVKAHTANSDLGTGGITCIGELVQADGTATTVATGNGFLFKLSGTTLTTLTYGGGGVAPTISADNWKFCQLNGVAMFWQVGYDPLIYDPAISTTTFRRLNEKAGTAGTVFQCNEAISAYGRVWCAGTATDKHTVAFSDLLTPHIWTGGTSGTLDVSTIWPNGNDEIVGLSAHNNFLFIFGKKQILVYKDVDMPSTMSLQDTIVGIGCIARDSISNVGEDVFFLSDTGVRSLLRTIQEKSVGIRGISKNVHDDLQDLIDVENMDNVRGCYSATNTFYLLTLPATGLTVCFDTRTPLQDGSSKTTLWVGLVPTAFCETRGRKFYMGVPGYIGRHEGYVDDTSAYRMTYYSTWLDFGNPIQTSIVKKCVITVIGLVNQGVAFKWGYDYTSTQFSYTTTLSGSTSPAEYGTQEYGNDEYSSNVRINVLHVPTSSAGRVFQFGMEAQVNGAQIAIQRIDMYTKDGKL